MKKLSKILAMLLVVAMMASLVCIPALADEPEDPYASLKEGTGYVAIGDSFTRGYGASDHWRDQIYKNQYYGVTDARNVDGSYPNIVADHFGLYAPNNIFAKDAQLWHLSHDAVSTAYILDLLGIDDGYRDDEFTYQDGPMIQRYSTDLAYFGDPLSYTLDGTARYDNTGEIMSVRDMLANASLISVGLGQTDVIYKAQILGLNVLDLNDTASLPAGIAHIVDLLYQYFEYWKGAYPLLLDYLKEVNPDAKVVLVGFVNPIQNATLSEDVAAPIGTALNIIFDLMNKFVKECAEEYGYMFIDISNVECPATENDLTLGYIMSLTGDESGLMAHPTPAGYAQIARMIINAVEEELAEEAAADPEEPYVPELPDTFIKVDLGRFDNVDYVVVDGDRVTNFTMDGTVLTVPCYKMTANTLAVAVKNANGKTTLITYSLSYDNGYVAHRVYETNDAASVATKVVKTFVSTAKSVVTKAVSTVKNLFGGLIKK